MTSSILRSQSKAGQRERDRGRESELHRKIDIASKKREQRERHDLPSLSLLCPTHHQPRPYLSSLIRDKRKKRTVL